MIILDEPTVDLIPNQVREIHVLFRELNATYSVILSTHSLPEVESVFDRVHMMSHGYIAFVDKIVEILLLGFRVIDIAAGNTRMAPCAIFLR